MSRGLSIIALLLLAVVSFGLYQLSYEVQRLEEELIELNRALSQERETIGVLQAEWSYLSRPDYLQDKAQRLLEMRSTTAKDIVAIEALPWRQDRGPAVGGPQPAPAVTAPALPPMAAAPAPVAPVSSMQVAAQIPNKPVAAEAPAFDAEVAAVLGAMQRGGKEPRRAQ
ncbi:hypothetical protein FNB15_13270 [Ferrovibrio terrae]|uniref:Cell division protein FtsL n=1 Tax=Ferrovibrio terrae TaxID=2594003 RepID=A0A516H330_9PROT|nr:hypothetical protein [Ferrovibrio terrae]QDO98179.1 hypothetical protein FNB15_13270 [Ferrovibrio terrae]